LEDNNGHILLTDSMLNLSGVSSSTVSFSCTVMIKGCKREMTHLADPVNYGYDFVIRYNHNADIACIGNLLCISILKNADQLVGTSSVISG
jgi:hypothetical protein